MKNKKTSIIIIIILVVIAVLVSALFLLPKKEKDLNVNNSVDIPYEEFDGENAPAAPQVDNKGNDCTAKGNVCSIFQIGAGILKSIKVNDTDTIDFYVLSNDEDTLTLISKDILFKTAWNKEQFNFNGPETLFKSIYENTKTWTNVKPITFEYSDYGHDYYKSICGNQYNKTVDDYECIIGQNGVGYENFKIDNNGIHFKSGYGTNYDIGNGNIYARTLTMEEAERLISYNHKITWLSGDEPFWTMTSDSDIYASMIFSAYYVKKNPDATTNYQLSHRHVEDEIGVRPIITIDK